MESTSGQVGRRTFLRGASAVGVAAAASTGPWLTGCTSDGDDDALTFFFGANPEERAVREKIIKAFSEKYPEIKIRTSLAGPDPLQQMLTYCAGGKCPDIMMAWELTYSGMAKRGALLDLNEMLDKDPTYKKQLLADSSGTLYKTFNYNGVQAALPEQFSGVFLYYNKNKFEEAGLEPPPARWEDAWTYDEFFHAAKAMTKPGSATEQEWGFVDPWAAPLSAGVFAMNNGVPWFSPSIDPTKTHIDDDRFIEGYQFYADLSVKHRVAPRNNAGSAQLASDTFVQGKAGMAILGHWAYPMMTGAKNLDFDVTVLPVGPNGGKGSRSDVGVTGLAIAADSPRKDEAWEFVKFATGPEGQRIIAESALFIPVLKSAANGAEFKKAHRHVNNLEVFTGGLVNANYLPITPVWGKIDALFSRDANRIFRGAAEASSFKGGLATQINDLLKAP